MAETRSPGKGRSAGASAPHPHPEKSGHGHNEGESAERARAVRSPAQREGTESPEQGVAVAPSGGQPGMRASEPHGHRKPPRSGAAAWPRERTAPARCVVSPQQMGQSSSRTRTVHTEGQPGLQWRRIQQRPRAGEEQSQTTEKSGLSVAGWRELSRVTMASAPWQGTLKPKRVSRVCTCKEHQHVTSEPLVGGERACRERVATGMGLVSTQTRVAGG